MKVEVVQAILKDESVDANSIKIINDFIELFTKNSDKLIFKELVKAMNKDLQQSTEKMYSEEDMEAAYEHGSFSLLETGHGDLFEDFIKKYKKAI